MMLPRIQRIRRGDRVICYHRPSRLRLPDLAEDHPDFVAAWARAEAQIISHAPPVDAGSLAGLTRALKSSARWKELSRNYQALMIRHLDVIMTDYGTAPARGLRPKHIEKDLAKPGPNVANHRLRAWRLLLGYAKSTAITDEDVSLSLRKQIVRTEGHSAWTETDAEGFRAHWPLGSVQRAAFELLCWTGARVSDAVALGPKDIDKDGLLSFKQVKTGGLAYIPWNCSLPPWAVPWAAEREMVKRALPQTAITWLATSSGARSVKGLSNLISAAAKEAGIEGKSAHGLRKYRLSMIAEAGASSHAIMAWSGHSSLSEAERYTRSATKKRLVMG